MTRAEDGSITPLIAVILACGALLAVTVARIGEGLVGEYRAQLVANASALAGIYGGDKAADQVAQRNGGVVINADDLRETDSRFTATVTVNRYRATAWAVDTWTPATSTLTP